LISVTFTRPLLRSRLADNDYLTGLVDHVLLPAVVTT